MRKSNNPRGDAFGEAYLANDVEGMKRWLDAVEWKPHGALVCLGLAAISRKEDPEEWAERVKEPWCLPRRDQSDGWKDVCKSCPIGKVLESSARKEEVAKSPWGPVQHARLRLEGFTRSDPVAEILNEDRNIAEARRDTEARLIVAIEKGEKGSYQTCIERLSSFLEPEHGGHKGKYHVQGGGRPCEKRAPDIARLAALHLIRAIALWARADNSLSAALAHQAGLAYQYLRSAGNRGVIVKCWVRGHQAAMVDGCSPSTNWTPPTTSARWWNPLSRRHRFSAL